jgi:outer membrane biosynthesis protein TonB
LVTVDNTPGSEHHISSHISPNTRGSILIGASVWVTASGFGLSMRLNQIKTEPSKQLDKGVCLLDKLLQSGEAKYQSVEDPAQLTDEELEVERPVTASDPVEDQLEEEDVEEVEDEVSEHVPTPKPAPAPEPSPKKKVPVTKKVVKKA